MVGPTNRRRTGEGPQRGTEGRTEGPRKGGGAEASAGSHPDHGQDKGPPKRIQRSSRPARGQRINEGRPGNNGVGADAARYVPFSLHTLLYR
ncbi:hypothetical protein B0T18DRAFT_93751 [Schizothecium vesticola]|uniref:Uncharacterized protein n=1 Tax=Schizothecium vesticola TaxID=314040 RepID=A0AA40F7J5_9PEZI|nr:hypothetical protein B0T18DRAFT_93751 [Schizothecium vesticola]